jgi:hypothetical protein
VAVALLELLESIVRHQDETPLASIASTVHMAAQTLNTPGLHSEVIAALMRTIAAGLERVRNLFHQCTYTPCFIYSSGQYSYL